MSQPQDLNRTDLLQRAGLSFRRRQVLVRCSGLNAGVIDEVGAGCDWKVGDPRLALLSGGGMAERWWLMRVTHCRF
jgi:NADPH:quinone reductase-like Zn-dependent oxidoreductase